MIELTKLIIDMHFVKSHHTHIFLFHKHDYVIGEEYTFRTLELQPHCFSKYVIIKSSGTQISQVDDHIDLFLYFLAMSCNGQVVMKDGYIIHKFSSSGDTTSFVVLL